MITDVGNALLAEQRAEPRINANGQRLMMASSYFTEQILLENIARLGFLGRSRVIYRSGDEVSLHLPIIGPTPAVIIWQNNALFGARFCDPINMSLFGDMLEGLSLVVIEGD